MLHSLWTFLTDPVNRATLGWIGGIVVTVVGAIWTVIQFRAGRSGPAPPPTVRADRGSVAIGGNNIASPIDRRRSGKR